MKAHRKQYRHCAAWLGVVLGLVCGSAHSAMLQVYTASAILDHDGVTPLQGNGRGGANSCLVQCIYAGPDGQIAPASQAGTPSGDDELLELAEYAGEFSTAIGEGFPYAENQGRVSEDFIHFFPAGSSIYLRAWNAATIDAATYYGDSALYALDRSRGETRAFDGWTLNQSRARFPLTLSANPAGGGEIQASPAPGTDGLYADGTEVQLRAVPSEGYDFGSWAGNLDGAANPATLIVNGAKSVAANFVQKRFALTINNGAGGSVVANPPADPSDGKYAYGTVVTLTAQPAAGYTFAGWGSLGTNTTIQVTMTANTTVTASFGQPRYGLTSVVLPTSSGTVSASPAPGNDGKYPVGTVVTLTANPASGYVFSSWGGAVSGSNSTVSLVMNGDVSVIANFAVRRYSLVVSPNPASAGTVTASPPPDGNGAYPSGTVVTLTAHPADGYALSAWGGDAAGKALTTTITMNANKTATANFVALRYQLTVNSNPAGAGTVTQSPPPGADGKYGPGTVVTLTANPAAGRLFDRWTGDMTGTANPLAITMTGNKTVTAVFRTEDGCRLAGVAIAAPEDGARFVLPAGTDAAPMTLTSEVTCSDDTARVTYSINGQTVGSAATPPYAVAVADIKAFGTGAVQIAARAESKQSQDLHVEDTVTITVEQAAAEDDGDSNGLPDNPFSTLLESGDTWIASVAVPGAQAKRIVNVARWDGAAAKAGAMVALAAQDPANALRRVTVQAPQNLIQPGEIGILVLEMAPDLVSLMGSEQAALMADPPPGGLVSGGRFAEVSVLVSTDGGASYDEIAADRVAQNPVHIAMSGVLVTVADTVDFYSHPSFVDSDPQSGLYVRAETGAWTSDNIGKPAIGNSTIEADMTALSVVAPFNVLAGGSSGCAAGSTRNVLGDVLILVALMIALSGVRGTMRRLRKL